jgi:Putative homoserine kinase type II (protein kinase fold)
MNYKDLKITTVQAENILLELYGIKGSANELPGEVDFNFRINTENDEGFILKISRPEENEMELDFQIQLLNHLKSNNEDLIVPKAVKDKNGLFLAHFTDEENNRRSVRLFSWVEGRIWSHVNPQLEDLRSSLGKYCGLLTKRLTGFGGIL